MREDLLCSDPPRPCPSWRSAFPDACDDPRRSVPRETPDIHESGHEYTNSSVGLLLESPLGQGSAERPASPVPSCRLRSASQGACAPGVGLHRRKEYLFGRRRPTIGRRPSRRLKSAFQGAGAPSVGLRRRKECLFGRRRPTIGRRPLEVEFIRRPRPTISRRPSRRLRSAS